MDLIKTGKFIADLRKEQRLTQEQLGEKLGVTNKTVSRWETGTYLPPAEALLSMSEFFDVSINEILSGKRLPPEEYKNAAEENLTEALKESSFTLKDKLDFYKKKWLKEHTALIILIGIIIIAAFAAGIILNKALLSIGAIAAAFIAHIRLYNSMMGYAENRAYVNNKNEER